ncbi:S1 family peptidase [Klebsiella pneumoniae]|uniref:S1 family peptidase n=1 Tax=Klebsiella pneumoniae TaxID=573 RepID=UPI0007CCEE8D|nr:serine protease [Klebsiella pneumoniae]EIX9416845.1 trypsin-like peptidase domain-containing protein [Klebsiella pneumoniae]EKX1863091.1 trypsin-like peptidase domain-containing protein [Klebsiella pneumoniae]MBE0100879.1 trypsin-like peptidase domain-containing protein [Klebsiella pneumoniae]MCD5916973.1 serine protease [Klebsiella pneumoniae]MDA5116557.1 serine protease [Klebsiella pneumoniae]
MSVSQLISKSTVRIECDVVGGGVSVGTGFWFAFSTSENSGIPLLVTNKHVIANSTAVRIRLNVSSSTDPNLKFYDVIIDLPSDFIHHPNPNVDICALPVTSFLMTLRSQGIEVDNFFFTDEYFRNRQYVTPVEEVFMIGYPNGLWDSVNNRPIIRKGITASSLLESWQGRPEFMIDMACFGGSSGSPVFIMNDGGFPTSNGWAIGNRFIFLGLLYAGPTLDVNGSINIVDVPTVATPVVSTTLMMNLGMVIKAEQLNGLRPLLGI